MERVRVLRALYVDVSLERAAALDAALSARGCAVHAARPAGAAELARALADPGWDFAVHAGDGAAPLPTRKAVAIVHDAAPSLPFFAVSASTAHNELAAIVKGLERGVLVAHDPESLARRVEEELRSRAPARRVDARRLLLAQGAVTRHVTAGLAPEELLARTLATLGDALGFRYAAVWCPHEERGVLRRAAAWLADPADAELVAYADAAAGWTFAAGRGLVGRVWAFRRPARVSDGTESCLPDGAALASTARLHAAVGFPIALGTRCLGVVELRADAAPEPDADLQALFATVGSQLAQHLERRRLQAAEARRVEIALRAERDRAQRYLDVAACIIVLVDPQGRIELVNRKGCDVIGLPEERLVGRDWIDAAMREQDRAAARRVFGRLVAGELEAVEALETTILTASGAARSIAWQTTLLRDGDGRVVGILAAGDDVTERRRSEEQISYLAYHDDLTGLPNRRLLEEHLKLALARHRRTGAELAVLHVGVDTFKLVNDSLGHAVGDELLARLAVRLQEAVRATDLVARVGGDEFLLLLADVSHDAARVAEKVAAHVSEVLAQPFSVGGTEFQLGASIGISCCPRDAPDADTLLHHADTAMHQAKQIARGGWTLYARDGRDPLERLSLSVRMRRALERHEFLLHYQPIYLLDTGSLQGVEALIRWRDPERGMVAPGDFIPVAEETGLIEAIGDWVLRAVCEQQVTWAAKGFHPQISFNVSPRQLRKLDFAERVALHLRETGANPSKLTLELTESVTLQDPVAAEPILEAVAATGMRIALDDFGAGYSSLSRLRQMPVETLKIDRAFMREVPENREAAAIVRAILRLCAALGRTTVAEGVETLEQRRFLEGEGCPLAQGFLLARPLPVEDVERLMARSGD